MIVESYPVDSLDETGWADLAVEDWLDSPVLSAVTFTASQMLKTPSLKAKIQNAGYVLSGAF
ncbi:hypothetical protein AB4Z48_30650 [Cupriavidus sp. 2TAF22]|uniref:hypothetical protein n=1 Tax=unclassified Cupriavidus TaxID=2640874 RepID=UPI003F927777